MLKIKIASVLVAGTLLLGGCASKSPINIDNNTKNDTPPISQEAKNNNAPQQSQPNTTTVSTTETPKAPVVKPENKAINETSNTVKPPALNKPAPAPAQPPKAPQPAKAAQASTVSQNGVEYLASVEDEVLRLCNVERSKVGLSPLVMAGNVREAARFKAQEMLTKNYFDHNSPYSGTPFDLMRNRGIQFGYGGENIQMSQGKDKATVTAQYLVTNWMNSPGHRANILKPEFKKMGIGVAFSSNGNKAYESQLFTD